MLLSDKNQYLKIGNDQEIRKISIENLVNNLLNANSIISNKATHPLGRKCDEFCVLCVGIEDVL